MLRFILKRIAIMPLMLLVITFLLFLVINISPTDPAIALLPSSYTQEDLDALHEEYGFNDPVVVQYVSWLSKAISGDLGISYQTKMSIWDEVMLVRLPLSAKVAVVCVIFVMVVSVPLGVICAVKQYTWIDLSINLIAKALAGIPAFLYGIIFAYIFSIKLKILPTYGLTSPAHWILPVIASSMSPMGGTVRQTRSSMLDCIRQEYITTARSKGIPERSVIFSEALRNALLPVITMAGQQFAVLIGGSVVIEKVFAIPGLGAYIVSAITYKDTPAVMGATAILALFFMVIMLIVDISYGLVDPRTRSSFVKPKATKHKIKGATA